MLFIDLKVFFLGTLGQRRILNYAYHSLSLCVFSGFDLNPNSTEFHLSHGQFEHIVEHLNAQGTHVDFTQKASSRC